MRLMGARWWPFSASRDTRRTFDASGNQNGTRFAVDIPPEMLEAMTGSGAIDARISRREALQVPAVLRSRNLIASTMATLPLRYHAPDKTAQPWPLFDQTDPEIPNSVLWAQTFEDLIFEGVAWWRVTKFGWHGFPVEARHVPVESVHVGGTVALPSQSRVSADHVFPVDGQVFVDGVPVSDNEIIRFDSPNPPLLRHAARAIRTALKLDRAAALYSDDPMPLGAFVPQEGADPLSTEPNSAGDGTGRSEVDALLDEWEAARARRAWGYVAGVKPELLQWDPKKLQLAEQRQHAVLEIARAVGVDPEDLGVSTTSRTYQNSEDRRKAFLDFTLGPWVSAVQDRLSMRDVTPRGYVARFDFAGFLRSDALTRMQVYKAGLAVGAYVEEEIRELEDRPALTPAQRARRSGAGSPDAPEPVEPATTEEPVEESMSSDRPGLRAVSFDHAAAGEADYAEIMFASDVAFRIDKDKRTISGLAVPWGAVAYSRGAKWRFREGSLRWSADSRVKLNMDHDHSQVVGRGIRLQSVSTGLDVTFKVAETAEGDRALALASSGVYDGFSIEVGFDGEADGFTRDPADESVRLVHSASLGMVALTPQPAFDDARVAAVAASRHMEGQSYGPEDAGAGEDRPARGRRVRVRSRRLHREVQ